MGILDLPYNFYILLRWIVCPAFLYLAFKHYKKRSIPMVWVFGVLGGIYNPLVISPFRKEMWIVLNAFSILALVYDLFRTERKSIPYKHLAIAIALVVIAIFIAADQCYLRWDRIFE